jgi:DNA-binding MarR family transcriptional regulator
VNIELFAELRLTDQQQLSEASATRWTSRVHMWWAMVGALRHKPARCPHEPVPDSVEIVLATQWGGAISSPPAPLRNGRDRCHDNDLGLSWGFAGVQEGWPPAIPDDSRGAGRYGTTGAEPATSSVAMNAIYFSSKRAFHGILRVTRRPLRSLGLTAARFDMLYALMYGGADSMWNGTRQSELRRSLGASASVVSRMLTSLEKLGWVTRTRLGQGQDRRQRWVRLTASGLRHIAMAFKMLRRASWRLVHESICFGKHRDDSARLVHTDQLESYLRGMCRQYGDTATLYYPWHPDD